MKKYSSLLSAAVMIGTIRVKEKVHIYDSSPSKAFFLSIKTRKCVYETLCPQPYACPERWGWLGSVMVLGKLPVPGRPSNLADSRARAYCACSGCGWGLFGHFWTF